MINDFAVFIISHNNPYKCTTYEALRVSGYTGQIYIVVDTFDPSLTQYLDKYPEVLVFDKTQYFTDIDIGESHNGAHLSVAIYARAAVEDMAKSLNLKYFIVFDDDIVGFRIRYPVNNKLISFPVLNIGSIFESYIELLSTTNIGCLSFANDGSFIGGIDSFNTVVDKRVCYTVFIRDVTKPLTWSFTVNEDHISSLRMSPVGYLMFTLPFVQRTITGMNNRVNDGSATMYSTTTDFQRAFYSTIVRPDVCKPRYYKNQFVISTDKQNAFPKIISDKYRKDKNYATV